MTKRNKKINKKIQKAISVNEKLKDLKVNRGTREQVPKTYSTYGAGMIDRSNKESLQRLQFLVGVDEAGRGPLAGPVSVGVVVVPYNFDWSRIPGVGDSKKVSPRRREEIFKIAERMKRKGEINFHVALVSNNTIDRINISLAVKMGITQCFKRLALDPQKTSVKLDGLLKAPSEFVNQETIIKGDVKEKVIGLASILAKVTRDRMMVLHGKKYPRYFFEAHKGYGTELHRKAIVNHGLTPLHRQSFCKNLLGKTKPTQK